jgi:hypothetical protein
VRPCDKNIKKVLQLTNEMLLLAHKGDLEREDIGCGVLYGMLLDYAYKLKDLAERERAAHIAKGLWHDS